MSYRKFLIYNIIGGIAWVVGCLQAGYRLGSNDFVKNHFEVVVIIIVAISLLPAAWEFALVKFWRRAEPAGSSLGESTTPAMRE